MKRISKLAALAVLACGLPLSYAYAGHDVADPCCDPCNKPGFLQRIFQRDCCDPCPKEKCCKEKCPKEKCCKEKCPKEKCCKEKCPKEKCCKEKCPKEKCCKEKCPKPVCCEPKCDPCDPCAKRGFLDRIRDHMNKGCCAEPCKEVKCDPCDPCARKFRIGRKHCCDGAIVEHHAPVEKKM